MRFEHETNLITTIDVLKITKEELDTAASNINGQNVKAGLEVSPQRRLLAKAQAIFKDVKEVGGDESKERAFCGKLQISCFV